MSMQIQFVIAALVVIVFFLGYRHGTPQGMNKFVAVAVFALGLAAAIASAVILVSGGPVLVSAGLLIGAFLTGLTVGVACGPNRIGS